MSIQSKKQRVALLFGGRGSEHLISCRSAASIARALTGECELYTVGITKEGELYLFSGKLSDMENGSWHEDRDHLFPVFFTRRSGVGGLQYEDALLPVDVAFPALHGDFGEDGRIQGMLEVTAIPYVGAPTDGGVLSSSKILSKILAEHLSISTVAWCTVSGQTSFAEAKLMIRARFGADEYPLILKPDALGSSIGIRTVCSDEELRSALKDMSCYGDLLIERYLPELREIELCYLESREGAHFSIGEVSYHKTSTAAEIYSYEKKYHTDTIPFKRALLSQRQEDTLRHYAKALISLLHLRDLARIDFFLDSTGNLYFNEINSFPGFTERSFYPQGMKMLGFDYKALLLTLLEQAHDRSI